MPLRMTAAGFRRLCNGLMREPHYRTGMTTVLSWNQEPGQNDRRVSGMHGRVRLCGVQGNGNRMPLRMTAAGFRRLCNGLMREPHYRTGMTTVLSWNRLKRRLIPGSRT